MAAAGPGRKAGGVIGARNHSDLRTRYADSRLDFMSNSTYCGLMNGRRKPLVWLHGEVKSPPFAKAARVEAGTLLRLLQEGELLGLPHSRPMPGIGPRCHELRVRDEKRNWRIVYRVDSDAIIVAEVFAKTTQKTPKPVIVNCRTRLRKYDEVVRDGGEGS
jgi:phage-related protein